MILCTGGESTGTRLAARIVEELGGEAVHRSFPHAQGWPNLSELDFTAAVVMTRDWWCAMPSQVKARHVQLETTAERQLRRAYEEIATQLNEAGKPWRFVSYEALITEPWAVITNLSEWLDLPYEVTPSLVDDIRDENRKWR